MLNLEDPGALPLLSKQILADIDTWCETEFDGGHRSHLGASVIGQSCSRALWYMFRWVYHVKHSGQQQRLFQRGHFEEPRFTSYLEGIGCEVTVFDKLLLFHPESDSYFYGNVEDITDTVEDVEGIIQHEEEAKRRGVYLDKGKRQIRMYACDDHFAGSIDAKIKLPTKYMIEQDVLFLGEYKTQGCQKFPKLQNNGVVSEKYQHFCQQSIYGLKLGLQYSVYMAVNKNNDDLHVEVIKLDWTLGKELENKAHSIIFSNEPPNKISASSSYYECKWCDYFGICWSGQEAEKNCRSCARAKAIENASWHCNFYDGEIPKEFVKVGCKDWISII